METAVGVARAPIYDLEGARLDTAERRLERDGRLVPLTPKAFDLLVHLVERAGRLVEKPALMAAIWPGTYVEEANLAFQVSSLRKALDRGRPTSMIETVPTRGYRFVGAVSIADDQGLRTAATDPPEAALDAGRLQERRAAVILAAAFAGLAAVVLVADLYDPADRAAR